MLPALTSAVGGLAVLTVRSVAEFLCPTEPSEPETLMVFLPVSVVNPVDTVRVVEPPQGMEDELNEGEALE